MDQLPIARIKNGTVINLEVADADWIASNTGIDDLTYIAYTDDNPAHIGLTWTEEEGFEQPPSLVEEAANNTTEGAE